MVTILLIISLVFLLAASAFFSSSETALFSISQNTLNRWADDGNHGQKLAAHLMEDHHALLTLILLGTNFVNTLYTMVFKSIINGPISDFLNGSSLSEYATIISIIVSTLLITLIVLIFGEITPKVLSYAKATTLAPRYAKVLNLLNRPMQPIIMRLKDISAKVLTVLGDEDSSNAISVDEYETFINMANSAGVFSENESTLFMNVFAMRHTRTSKIMIPRTDIAFLNSDCPDSELMAEIQKQQQRYLPVIDETFENIEGLFDTKKYCMLAEGDRSNWRESCLHKAVYVPENAPLNKVLLTLKETQIGIAFVVDEFGGVEGMISAKDIFEQLVGEMHEETEQQEWVITQIVKNHWRLSALIPVEQLMVELNIDLGETKATTLGGWILEQMETIPQPGEHLKWENFSFIVRRVVKNRIIEVDLLRMDGGNK